MNLLQYARERWRRRNAPNPLFVQLLAHSQQVIKGARAFDDFVHTPSRVNALRVQKIEREADKMRRALVANLNRTFVTPIDREDIFSLSRTIDDIVDDMYSITREMYVLKIAPDKALQRMARLLYECTREICEAIGALEDKSERAEKHALRVLSYENRMAMMYSKAMASMYQDAAAVEDIVLVLKRREIYRQMVNAADSAKQAANLINDIIIKFY